MFLDFHLIVNRLKGEEPDSIILAVVEAPVSRRGFDFDRSTLDRGLRGWIEDNPGLELEELRGGQLQLRPKKGDSYRPQPPERSHPAVGTELRLSELLFSGLFPEGSHAYDLLGRSCLRANGEGKDLRLKLELHPTLSNLPWESMRWPDTGPWAHEIRRTKISCLRYLGNLREPERLTSPGRPILLILLADPEPTRTPELTASFRAEVSRLRGILRRHKTEYNLIEGPGTLRQLRDFVLHLRADQRPILGLHFIGHGGVDEEGGYLLGESEEEGHDQRIHGTDLIEALNRTRDLRWAIFNACGTAYQPMGSPLAGLATAIAELMDVPTVIAYQGLVATNDAESLAPELYKLVLEQGMDIAEAVRALQIRYDHPGGLVVLAHSVEGRVAADFELGTDIAVAKLEIKQRRASCVARPGGAAKAIPGPSPAAPGPAEGELGAMILIPAGSFQKGLSSEQVEDLIRQFRDQNLDANLESAREVLRREPQEILDLPAFEIDRVLVTNRQYDRFVEATGYLTEAERAKAPQTWRSYARPDRQEHPVVLVSYYDAQQFCSWAGKRLPTADEWKKAYRGAEGRAYPWGEAFDPNLCNTAEGEYGWQTTPVGQFLAGQSPYGCMDLLGNVDEWTSTPDGAGSQMVLGASWAMVGQIYGLPVLHRRASPQFYSNEHGFRCARDAGR